MAGDSESARHSLLLGHTKLESTPNRTIPRALAIAMLTTTILYVADQFVAQHILGAALATSKAPLADAMAQIHPALRALMLAGAALSMFGYLGSDILGSPRQLFALARDGLLPGALGRFTPAATPLTLPSCAMPRSRWYSR